MHKAKLKDQVRVSDDEMFGTHWQITIGNWKGEEGKTQVEKFNKDVIERMSEPPWKSSTAKKRNASVQLFCELKLLYYTIILNLEALLESVNEAIKCQMPAWHVVIS